MFLIYPSQQLPDPKNLLCMNRDIWGLTRGTTRWFYRVIDGGSNNLSRVNLRWIMILALGRQWRFPFSPIQFSVSYRSRRDDAIKNTSGKKKRPHRACLTDAVGMNWRRNILNSVWCENFRHIIRQSNLHLRQWCEYIGAEHSDRENLRCRK